MAEGVKDRAAELHRAFAHHAAGRLREAVEIYNRLIYLDPPDADALHQLGVIANQTGNPVLAVETIRRALAIRPGDPMFLANLGEALRRLNRLDEAITCIREALVGLPNIAELHGNLALVLLAKNDLDGARASLEHALTLKPDFADAHFNLATLRAHFGDHEAAVAHFDRALALRPDDVATLNNRGRSQLKLGRSTAAAASFAAALAQNSGDPNLHANHGVALLALGQSDAALASFERALALTPDNPDALKNLGDALQALGRLDQAVDCYGRALALRPGDSAILNNLGNVQLLCGRTGDAAASFERGLAAAPGDVELLNSRGKLHVQQGRLAAARADFEAALARAPERHEIRSNLLCQLNYDPAVSEEALAAAHQDYGRRLVMPAPAPYAVSRDPERPLHVGYVSADFGQHPVGWFFASVIESHDRARVVATCYSGRLIEDAMTARIRGAAARWRPIVGLTDDELVALIRADEIDVLVDLSGHTAGNRLPVFARRPAPVQASWIGYFNTTGLAAVDAVLVDEATVPTGTDHGFAETVVRLPAGRLCYAPPDYAPAVAPPPQARRGDVTLGSFNNVAKLTPAVLALWADVLRAVPRARLLLKWHTLDDADERRRLSDAFAAHGIDAARLELRGYSPHASMLTEYGDVDIALDPFPFCGGLTSCEALWMGVPVITLPGVRPVSRQTFALLTQLGLTELAAQDAGDYVARVAALAGDAPRLAALRAGLRARISASTLGDGPRFTRTVEDALRALWRRWCAG